MIKFNTIAVGTDGSATALRAVSTAASMANAYDAKLVIVTAFYNVNSSMWGSPSTGEDQVPLISEDMADTFLTQATEAAEAEGVKDIKVLARSGDPVNVMTSVVQEEGADVLVVGNKGVHSLRGRVFGNVATELMRKSPVDVMVVNTENDR